MDPPTSCKGQKHETGGTQSESSVTTQVVPDGLSIHPRHLEQMTPHQVEGFNFLVKNLADENNPGGCILAHETSTGKTFMLTGFVQSFLASYPAGRALIILPKATLPTWKSEFLNWKIEVIPLHDFYSSKAAGRSEQLKILNLWEEKRSILLLGYNQFSQIALSDDETITQVVMCREKLLKVPSLVVLDGGQTPRNEQTNLLAAFGNIQTPKKVWLTGTLFNNPVSEVFNILNRVRPTFLKMERSRAIVKRILSKVSILGEGARSDDTADKYFYDVVEEKLQRGASDKMRVMIIQNLRELTDSVTHCYQGELSGELPGLVDFTVFLNMSTEQGEIIRGLVGLDNFAKRAKCSAVSLHPCLMDAQNQNVDEINGVDINAGAKAKFICNLLSLSEAAGEKVLVFSQYMRSLLFLEMLVTREKGWTPALHTFKIDGGSISDKAVERFNHSPDARVLFGSIKACGQGISLVGASRIVILDVHKNPSVMRQAIGRAFGPGQSKMVYCYRLVAANSLEEKDHHAAFHKERVSKLWFEWDELCDSDDFELAAVDVSKSGDRFLESPTLRQYIKSIYKM